MPDCPNLNCRTYSGERTQIATDANYCIACGTAVSDKAKEKQKRKENNIRSRKLNDANSKISLLQLKIIETDKCLAEFENTIQENQTLKILLEREKENFTKHEDFIKSKKDEVKEYLPLILITALLLAIVIIIVIIFRI